MQKKNIFIVYSLDIHRAMFDKLEYANECVFHWIISPEILISGKTDVELLEYARQKLTDFEGSIDGIIGFCDFPISTMVPILSEEFGLPFTPLTSYLKCDHKYWSRLEQKASIPEFIPKFAVFDAFDDASFDALPLPYPFWIKPVRSVSSYLGFKIESRDDFERAKPLIYKYVDVLLQPFDSFLQHVSADFPNEIRQLPAHCFLAEELIGGHQCSLEGSMQNNKLYVCGFVDSIFYPNSSSFLSFQYPSKIPQDIQHEMAIIGERFLQHIKFDNVAFHIEFFWNPEQNTIRLIEVNTRMAFLHSYLFYLVEGVANHQVPLNLVLGYTPILKPRETAFNIAAVLFYRVTEDAYVEAIPSKQDIAEIEAKIPGAVIDMEVSQGDRLSKVGEVQHSYMYLLWEVSLGAENEEKLDKKYQQCIEYMNAKLKLRPCD